MSVSHSTLCKLITCLYWNIITANILDSKLMSLKLSTKILFMPIKGSKTTIILSTYKLCQFRTNLKTLKCTLCISTMNFSKTNPFLSMLKIVSINKMSTWQASAEITFSKLTKITTNFQGLKVLIITSQ